MSRILLVEDEAHLAEGLAFNLRNSGYYVAVVDNGEDALETARGEPFDLILLDVMLPGVSGIEVARRLRKSGRTEPILMLSARDRAHDAIAGLDAGADDYITKPFDLDEVLARIRGSLRRQVWERAAPALEPGQSLSYGDWEIDFQGFTARGPRGKERRLSPKEAEMLKLFAARPGEVISREVFLEEVWGMPASLETRTIDNFVRKLRQAFEKDPKKPRHILSIRGAGYRFVP